MARRYIGQMNGERFCGNTSSQEVHDLDQETANCQINEMLRAGHDRPGPAHLDLFADILWQIGHNPPVDETQYDHYRVQPDQGSPGALVD